MMGSYDCELVGLYILNFLQSIIPKEQIGIYRDDGLAVLDMSDKEAEDTKKKLCAKFNELGLNITAETNITIVDFLDVTFDLKKKEYKPYSKPGTEHQYVHTSSNHPPTVTRRIPQGIATRLCNISSTPEIFEQHKQEYEEALQKAGHHGHLTYTPHRQRNRPQRRGRTIVWYNPPYTMNLSTKLGKKFLALVDKHFPVNSELRPICNRNTIKLSYCCMNNMETIIKAHNSKILSNTTRRPDTCNCRDKSKCPLDGKCTAESVIYEATVTTASSIKKYIGLTANTFKSRFYQHQNTFRDPTKKRSTALSSYVWDLEAQKTPYTITWKIKKRAQSYSPRTHSCNLCLWEKVLISKADKDTLLNSRSELLSKCVHKIHKTLSKFK